MKHPRDKHLGFFMKLNDLFNLGLIFYKFEYIYKWNKLKNSKLKPNLVE